MQSEITMENKRTRIQAISETGESLQSETLQATLNDLRKILPGGRFTESVSESLLNNDTYTGLNREVALTVLGPDIPEERSAIQGLILGMSENPNLLVVGPGWGRITNEVSRVMDDESIFLLDVNWGALQHQKDTRSGRKNKVLATGAKLPFSQNTFKGAVMSVVLRYNLKEAGEMFHQALQTCEKVLVTEYGEHGSYVLEKIEGKYGKLEVKAIPENLSVEEQDALIKKEVAKEEKQSVRVLTREVEVVPYTSVLMLVSLATRREETIKNICEKSGKKVVEVEEILKPFTAHIESMGYNSNPDELTPELYRKMYKNMSKINRRKLTQYIIIGESKGREVQNTNAQLNGVE